MNVMTIQMEFRSRHKSNRNNNHRQRYPNETRQKRRIRRRRTIMYSLCIQTVFVISILSILTSWKSPHHVNSLGIHTSINYRRLRSTSLSSSLSSNNNRYNINNNNPNRDNKIIDEIKSEVDIITLIESYNIPQFTRLSIERATAICPFHNDNNPSLNIDNNKGLYKCFACGAGGDIFNFVREYDYLSKSNGKSMIVDGSIDGKEKKMSYPAAITKIANEFCSEEVQSQVNQIFNNNRSGNQSRRKLTPEEIEKIEAEKKKKERILLANSVAADFYAKSLITSPAAGSARSHLFQRGIAPKDVRTFALGYAPDAYFANLNQNDGLKNDNKNEWGKGSLVERLETMGFQPKEIVEAGLATVTSAAKNRLQSIKSMNVMRERSLQSNNSTITKGNKTIEDEAAELRYNDLMDRFRGRLMVPIFDPSGKYVIGFGGRDLDETKITQNIGKASNETKQQFRSPRYLNSPESLVFEKKNVLFGLHTAREGVLNRYGNNNRNNDEDDDSTRRYISNKKTTAVIVEGYFDAISLYGAGITEVTASMGAALTYQQLEEAATLVGEGRIIICLDNDDAGVNAVERLCSGSHLWDLQEKTNVEIAVGSLPMGIKDPGEFVELRSANRSSTIHECFESEVMDTAPLWTNWFIDQMIKKYDQNDSSGFAGVCDDITTFLSKNRNAADRTKQAYEAANKLATHISKDDNKEPSASLRIQLETDLLGMASRKASKRERIEIGIDAVERLAQADAKTTKVQSSNRYDSSVKTDRKDYKVNGVRKHFNDTPNSSNVNRQQINAKLPDQNPSKTRQVRSRQQEIPVIPHFRGFTFNPTDAAWLGLSGTNSDHSLILCDDMPEWKKKKQKWVYFNSNEYLGQSKNKNSKTNNNFKSLAAAQANALLNQNSDKLLKEAEFKLLQVMTQFPSARKAMKAALSNRLDDSPNMLEFSTPEREWLFHCLTESPGHESLPQELQDGSTLVQLKNYLRSRTDVPDDAFIPLPTEISIPDMKSTTDLQSVATEDEISNPQKVEQQSSSDSLYNDDTWFDTGAINDFVDRQRLTYESKTDERGKLDIFFIEPDNEDVTKFDLDKYSVSHDERAALTVQQCVAIMLQASAQKRFDQLKTDWKIASEILYKRKIERKDLSQIKRENETEPETCIHDDLTSEDLETLCNNLGNELLDAGSIVRELTESLRQLNRRLIDYCSDGREGQISGHKQDALQKMMAEHLATLSDERDKPGYSDDYIFGSDEFKYRDARYGGAPSETQQDGESTDDSNDAFSPYDSIFE